MESKSSKILSFPKDTGTTWIEAYQQTCLTHLPSGTVAVYASILRQFTRWVIERAKKAEGFQPDHLTSSLIERYLFDLSSQGYSFHHCKRVKSVITHFCQWLVDEKRTLSQNPARGVKLAQPSASNPTSPRTLSPQERVILQNLVKQDNLRGQALFALGYWTGCRVADLTHLLIEDTHVGAKSGWLHLGELSSKARDIDLVNEARRPLHAYLQKRARDELSPYVFTSQRNARLSEAGLHHWFRSLKQRATADEQAVIATISFHDLRDDFTSRALSAGWTLEETAYYLGHVTLRGTPAVQTTIRYTQMSRAQVKEKLKGLKG